MFIDRWIVKKMGINNEVMIFLEKMDGIRDDKGNRLVIELW